MKIKYASEISTLGEVPFKFETEVEDELYKDMHSLLDIPTNVIFEKKTNNRRQVFKASVTVECCEVVIMMPLRNSIKADLSAKKKSQTN